MKKWIIFLLPALLFACRNENVITTFSVANPSSFERANELAEVSLDALPPLPEEGLFVLLDANNANIPYQVTYDGKLIFPVAVPAHGEAAYTLKAGVAGKYAPLVYGRHYPERKDDIAWENDRIAFRTYGPALQATGEKSYGYDIWVKCVPEFVAESWYAKELDPEVRAQIEELKKTDRAAAQALSDAISYHIDHGTGMDAYNVGPTLGAGTSAFLVDGAIVYPYCYHTYEILENGPLRFTAKLAYHPLAVGEDSNVIETRVISLDAGSQLNRVTISFENLSRPTPLVTGIVLHETSDNYHIDPADGFMAYTDSIDAQNGQIFVGVVCPSELDEAKAVYFTESEKKERKASGHILSANLYAPASAYTYYTGGGWSKWGFRDTGDWVGYLAEFSRKIKEPLVITCHK
ncbi:MAG: DUF4861 domain-containing protein [Tannerellaceae bacterium]|jgi:hypothetical protein|nr:DUF4861 domain-containing protein [Tannerellaceae bacterium]